VTGLIPNNHLAFTIINPNVSAISSSSWGRKPA